MKPAFFYAFYPRVCVFWANVWNAPLAEWNELALRCTLTDEHRADLAANRISSNKWLKLPIKKTSSLPPQHTVNTILPNDSRDLSR